MASSSPDSEAAAARKSLAQNPQSPAGDLLTSALLSAADGGKLGTFKLLYNKQGVNKNVTNEHGQTPLMLASIKGNKEIVDFLLEQPETDVNVMDTGCEETALHHAVLKRDNMDTLVALWNHPQMDRTAVDGFGRTALLLAVKHASLDMVKFLLDQPETDIDAADNNGNTVLLTAAMNEDLETFKFLYFHPAVEQKCVNLDGSNVLFNAAWYGHHTILEFLLNQNDTDITVVESTQNKTVLHAAVKSGDLHKVRAVWNHPRVDRRAKMNNGMDALMLAAFNGFSDIVEFLLTESDVDVNDMDDNGDTALSCAIIRGHMDTFLVLFNSQYVRKDVRNASGWSLLLTAAGHQQEEIVAFLLNQPDTDVAAVDMFGLNAMHYAAFTGSLPVLKLLVDDGRIDKEAIDRDGDTALSIAAKRGSDEMVQLLLGDSERGDSERGDSERGDSERDDTNNGDNNPETISYSEYEHLVTKKKWDPLEAIKYLHTLRLSKTSKNTPVAKTSLRKSSTSAGSTVSLGDLPPPEVLNELLAELGLLQMPLPDEDPFSLPFPGSSQAEKDVTPLASESPGAVAQGNQTPTVSDDVTTGDRARNVRREHGARSEDPEERETGEPAEPHLEIVYQQNTEDAPASEDQGMSASNQNSPDRGSARPLRSQALPGPSSSKPQTPAHSVGKGKWDSDSSEDSDTGSTEPFQFTKPMNRVEPQRREKTFPEDGVARQNKAEGRGTTQTDGNASVTAGTAALPRDNKDATNAKATGARPKVSVANAGGGAARGAARATRVLTPRPRAGTSRDATKTPDPGTSTVTTWGVRTTTSGPATKPGAGTTRKAGTTRDPRTTRSAGATRGAQTTPGIRARLDAGTTRDGGATRGTTRGAPAATRRTGGRTSTSTSTSNAVQASPNSPAPTQGSVWFLLSAFSWRQAPQTGGLQHQHRFLLNTCVGLCSVSSHGRLVCCVLSPALCS